MTKPNPEPAPTPKSIPITELESKRTALTAARDQLRMQLNGVENQLYILNQLLNPDPTPAEDESTPPAPAPLPPGTI